MTVSIRDHDYIQQAFMLSGVAIDDGLKDRRRFQAARNKFTDTTPGGNFWINPPPQWSPTCDIRSSRFWTDQFSGMGSDYSVSIDDNADVVYFRMGVPEFNGMFTFLSNMFDSNSAYLARTGRSPGWLFKIAELASSIVHWPIQAISVTYNTVRWLAGIPKSKFYYSKPVMPLYWKACTHMLNQILINMGIVPRVFRTRHGQLADVGKVSGFDFSMYTQNERQQIANLLPGLWKADGTVDLFYLANRATRKQIRWEKALESRLTSTTNRETAIRAIYQHGNNWTDKAGDSSQSNLKTYLNSYFNSGLGSDGDHNNGVERAGNYTPDSDGDTGVNNAVQQNGQTVSVSNTEKPMTFMESIESHLASELRDGGAFIGFKVNHNGAVGESFSSSFKDNDLAGFFNGFSAQTNDARFTMSGGATGIPGIDALIRGAQDVVAGAISGTGLGGIANIVLGQGFVDIPQHWAGSTVSLPRETYTINLRSPYGHPVARIQNLIIPLVCLLNMALPHSAGSQAYTSPFLIEAFSKGRSQTRLGMVDSMSIQRGVGNVGWTRDKHPLGIDVTFSVVDLSPLMHIPIEPALNPGDLTNPAAAMNKLLTDDTNYSDYLNVLSAMGVNEQIYTSDKLARVLARTKLDVKQWVSPTQMAATFSNSLAGEAIKMFVQGTGRS